MEQQDLSIQDIELAKRYIVYSCAHQTLTQIKETNKERGVKFGHFYLEKIEKVLVDVKNELNKLKRYLITVKKVRHSTEYKVEIEKRVGLVRVSQGEIREAIAKMIFLMKP